MLVIFHTTHLITLCNHIKLPGKNSYRAQILYHATFIVEVY